MTMRLLKAIALISVALPSGAFATSWTFQTVGQLQVDSGTGCYYFTLIGVTQADPVSPSPWFAMPMSQAGAKDSYATLLAAKLSGQQVTATTNGTVVCGGYALVTWVVMH
jgi:hypothetical protein